MKLTFLAAPAAVALSLALATPAYAARQVHADPAKDVIRAECADMMSEDCTESPAPERADGDITRTAIRHGSGQVVIRVKHRDLTRREDRGHNFRIVTHEGLKRDIVLFAPAGSGQPAFVEMMRPDGRPVRCGRLDGRYDMAGDTAIVTIPRGCLSRPRWVRVGVQSFAFHENEEGFEVVGDDAFRSGAMADLPALSPRVRRG